MFRGGEVSGDNGGRATGWPVGLLPLLAATSSLMSYTSALSVGEGYEQEQDGLVNSLLTTKIFGRNLQTFRGSSVGIGGSKRIAMIRW